MIRWDRLLAIAVLSLVTTGAVAATEPAEFAAITEGLERREGLFDFFVDPDAGRIWLVLPSAPDGELGRYLYVEGLVQGLGSNPVGLDRGQIGPVRVIRLRLLGGRLLIEQPNLAHRALDGDKAERRAVEQSFVDSILWAGPVAARSPDGESVVDLTSFLVRDAHGVAARLKQTGQGSFLLDAERSVVDLEACLAFPDNLEFEARVTFAGDEPGAHVRSVAPDPTALTLTQHQSILRLPEEGYRPRRFDPRAGSIAIRFLDFAAPLDAPLEQAWIVRHRLEKVDRRKQRSAVKEPIVYYVDRGTPEPVRGALIEGAGWWSRAFEAAGFVDAFRVELLPEGVDPLDARYNVIQWVHRSTRGWSYGGGVVDPRTGERIKGHVSLGSLRVRQDRLLFEAILGTDRTGSGRPDDPIELALARIRQLAAHEVGHTLGLTHNFAASTYADRASVMDYPAPRIRLDREGRFDVEGAYGVGVGAWDLHAIRYAYSDPPPHISEEEWLEGIVQQGLRRGYRFLGDDDARPAGAAHPLANLWDNGEDPLDELERILELRRVALERFGERNVAEGRPLALLEEPLATLYFHHRYQVQAAVKSIGGLEYAYTLRGDGQGGVRAVDGARQRRALALMRRALAPETLDLDESILKLLPPRPFGHPPTRESFPGSTAPGFDALAAADAAASLVVDAMLAPQRCARLVDQHRRNPELPSLAEALDTLIAASLVRPEGGADLRRQAIGEVVAARVSRGLFGLVSDRRATAAVRAGASEALERMERRLGSRQDSAVDRHLAAEIRRFLARSWPAEAIAPAQASPPPGSPIGSTGFADDGCGGLPAGAR